MLILSCQHKLTTYMDTIECYRRFIALSKKQKEKIDTALENNNATNSDKPLPKITRSSITSPKSQSYSGIFPQICLLCSKARKKVGGIDQKLIDVLYDKFQKNIENYAKWLNGQAMLTRIASIDLSTKEVSTTEFAEIGINVTRRQL